MKMLIPASRLFLAATIALGFILSACAPQGDQSGEIATDTPIPSPTPTIEWFPPTPTIPIPPTPTPDTQPESLPGVGDLIYTDTFDESSLWTSDQAQAQNGNIAFAGSELTLAVLAPKATLQTFRRDPVLTDFYAEVTVTANLCQGSDAVGLLFRTNGNDSYRYLIDCSGMVSAQVVINGAPTPMQDWIGSGELLQGLPAPVKLAVWASKNTLRFFINDQFQFEINRNVYVSGGIGLYARAASDSALSVSFSNLSVYQVAGTPPAGASPSPFSATATPTP